MPDLPARFARLIITFAPLFVQRSWQHAHVLLVGAILVPGRRTVASVLRITGHARDKHFTNYHRVLSRAPWSARAGARILLGHLVKAFAPRGPVVVGLDDTIERRWGPKIAARGPGPIAARRDGCPSIAILCARRTAISSRRVGCDGSA